MGIVTRQNGTRVCEIGLGGSCYLQWSLNDFKNWAEQLLRVK